MLSLGLVGLAAIAFVLALIFGRKNKAPKTSVVLMIIAGAGVAGAGVVGGMLQRVGQIALDLTTNATNAAVGATIAVLLPVAMTAVLVLDLWKGSPGRLTRWIGLLYPPVLLAAGFGALVALFGDLVVGAGSMAASLFESIIDAF